MVIYTVKEGDTINSIANTYNVSVSRLIQNNDLNDPNRLVVGQTLVILTPDVVYTVKEGDTLLSVANQYNLTVSQLLQNNPGLVLQNFLKVGQELVVSYEGEKKGALSVNGYVYPYVNREVLLKTLPYLTYLTIFTYGFTEEGTLLYIDDDELIKLARDYGVAPMMLLATLNKEGVFSNELASSLLNNEAAQDRLIDEILRNLKNKNYAGLDFDFEFILPEDSEKYAAFVKKTTDRLNAEGFITTVDLVPKVASDQPGSLYEGHNYQLLGAASNNTFLMTYEWGYTYGPPMAVSPIESVKRVLNYAVTEIPPSKIFMGLPNYGYDWPLPYVKGVTAASTIGNVEAVALAAKYGVPIEFDEFSQAPYFNYTADDGVNHVVWFEDARTISSLVNLIESYGFLGTTFWNLMKFFPQSFLVINSLYDIRKVI